MLRVAERLPIEDINVLGSCDFLGDAVFGEFGHLDASLKKTIKKVREKAKRVVKKVGKGLKKGFIRAAPVLGPLAQTLNFVVPGLGVAVGAAITAGGAALAKREAKKEAKKFGKEAEAAAAAAEAQAMKEADEKAVAAYDVGESFFVSRYNMTRDKFMALSSENKVRFMNVVTYDANAKAFQARGISRDAFMEMTTEEQANALLELGEAIQAPKVAPVATVGMDWTLILVGGIVILGGIALIVLSRRKEQE